MERARRLGLGILTLVAGTLPVPAPAADVDLASEIRAMGDLSSARRDEATMRVEKSLQDCREWEKLREMLQDLAEASRSEDPEVAQRAGRLLAGCPGIAFFEFVEPTGLGGSPLGFEMTPEGLLAGGRGAAEGGERDFISEGPGPAGWLAIHDMEMGKPQWTKTGREEIPGQVMSVGACADAVYAAGQDREGRGQGWLSAFAGKTGKCLWKKPLGSLPGRVLIDSLHASSKGVIVAGGEHQVWLAKYAADSGKELWKRTLSRKDFSMLVPSSDRILAAGSGKGEGWIEAIDPATGKSLWSKDLPGFLACLRELPEGILAGGEWFGGKKDGGGWIGLYTSAGKTVWERKDLAGCLTGVSGGSEGIVASGRMWRQIGHWAQGIAHQTGAPRWDKAGPELVVLKDGGRFGALVAVCGTDEKDGEKRWIGGLDARTGEIVFGPPPAQLPGSVHGVRFAGDRMYVAGFLSDDRSSGWMGCYSLPAGLWLASGEDR